MINVFRKLFIKYIDFIKFCLVGVSNTAVSFLIYWICIGFGINYLFSSAIGYIISIFNGYLLSSRFVFKKSIKIKSVFRFFLIYSLSLLLNLFILYVLVDMYKLNKYIAQVIAIGINTIFNFVLNKLWAFK